MLWTLLLLPLLFFSVAGLPSGSFAVWFLLAGLLIAWGLSLLGDKNRLQAPKFYDWLAGGLSFILISRLLSAGFSGAFFSSLLGYGFETGTVSFGLVFIFLYLLSARYFNGSGKQLALIFGLISFTAIGSILALSKFFFTSFLPFLSLWPAGWFGQWSELAILNGFLLISSLVLLQFFSLGNIRHLRASLNVLLILSLSLIAFVNYRSIFLLAGIISLLIFLLTNLPLARLRNGRLWRPSFWRPAIVAIVLFGLFFFSPLNFIAHRNFSADQKNNSLEIRPNLDNSLAVAKNVLEISPIFGIGSAKWNSAWQQHKPVETNDTPFWNSDFDAGYNFIITETVNNGFLGLLAWLIFFSFAFGRGVSAILRAPAERKPFVWLFLLGFLYLTASLFFYSPGIMILVWLVVYSAILKTLTTGRDLESVKPLDDHGKIKLAFFFVAGVFIAYFLFANLASNLAVYFFNRSANADWRSRLIVASMVFPKDYVYRDASGVSLDRVKNLLGSSHNEGDLISQFEELSRRAFGRANSAVNLDPLNYKNYEARGQLAESLIPLGAIAGAGDRARSDYNKALELAPNNPALFLDLARLTGILRENDQLQFYVDQAIKMKADYAPALLLKSQLLVRTGDIEGAIELTKKAATLNPGDGATLFQWGYLLYSNSDYTGAEQVFLRAERTLFSPSTVKYYLALCSQKLGRIDEAVSLLEMAVVADPDNEDARLLLTKLRQPVKVNKK